ncbi:MAG: P63C domain-containing protein [Mycolicibacterium fortuitum]
MTLSSNNPAKVPSGRSRSGRGRAEKLSPERRREIARMGAAARWGQKRTLEPVTEAPGEDVDTGSEDADDIQGEVVGTLVEAKWKGTLRVLDIEIPCYVLSNGQRVIGRTSATEALTGIKGGGGFEKTIGVVPLRPYINLVEVQDRMVSFRLPEVDGLKRAVKGLPADLWIEVCQGFVRALEAHTRGDAKLTSRQIDMAIKASMFLSAVARVGLDALIDEATGYQYERAEDALQVKLHAYLEKEMRPWEKTFPDELWREFGRLTGWKGTVSKRPKYWGKLVMELVYGYLDSDVAEWLKTNAPAPRAGKNYHQWLSSQFGLQRLIEHIWKLIGVAQTCESMSELRDRMAELNGKQAVQLRLFVNTPGAQ